MIKPTRYLVAILATSACATDAPSTFRIDRTDSAGDGVPYVVRGTLGVADGAIRDVRDVDAAMAQTLPDIGRAIRVPADQLVATRVEHDALGMTHIKYAQRANGLEVVGGDVIVHLMKDGTVSSVTNGARDASSMPTTARIASSTAADVARTRTPDALTASAPELVYVITNGEGELHLAWRTDVKGPMVHDIVFVDAISGELVARHPQIQPAKNRIVFSGGDTQDNTVPSTQVGTEGSAPTDPVAKLAYDNVGTTYDFYSTVMQRDSYDNAGATLTSYVHITQNHGALNNAFWDGSEMVYGDGDGTTFAELPRALDVTAHELTHAVTGSSAMLVYQLESGALNEASSDILGASCEAHRDGMVSAKTWLVGEDIYTPNTPGDALRYMNNPTLDAPLYNNQMSSTDFYPERLKVPAGGQPDGSNDQGYVHFNSGIANLAFYLMSQGGVHPRAKTTYTATGIGIDKASRIWYRALTHYMTANETFAQARTATEMAAAELYPGATKNAVSMAWATVGVGAPITDTSPPTVHITSPQAGKVTPGFTVTADASDDQGVVRVEFSIDGAVVGSVSDTPYTFTSATSLTSGMHTVQATAYDAINHTSDSVAVNIVDPTCGNTCAMNQTCDMDTGMCVDKKGGGGCSTGGNGAGGSLVLLAALLLRRRRR